jgi:cobaltochelatase CobN
MCPIRRTGRFLTLVLFGLALSPAPLLAGQIVLLVSPSDTYLVRKAMAGLELPPGIRVEVVSAADLREESARTTISGAQVIVVDAMVQELTNYLDEHAPPPGKRIYAVRTSRNDEALKAKGYIFEDTVGAYFEHLSAANARNLVLCVVQREFDKSVKPHAPVKLPEIGLYHPDADSSFKDTASYLGWYRARERFKGDAGWIGVMLYPSSLAEGRVAPVNYLVRRLEEEGLNVMPAFGEEHEVIRRLFSDADGKPRPDVILAFSLKFRSSLDERLGAALQGLNVPVINGLDIYYSTISEWRRNPMGLLPTEVAWAIATPEISGIIEPSVLTGREKETRFGEQTVPHPTDFSHSAVEENIEALIPRLKAWIRLRRTPNPEKRVAVLFYNHSQGKQNIGASYLNVFASLEQILGRMREAGYRVEMPGSLDAAALQDLILISARNVGSWAPGELEALCQEGKVVRVPLGTYQDWFSALPGDFRQSVLKQWGEPKDSKIMVKDGYLIVPAVILGNVVLMPEPSRGWVDDPVKLYHSPVVFPHHQYTAAYLWIKHVFHADAMVHLGTHATHEWLPGKQAGLSPACPPEVLLADIPNLYPYIVDNVGEGIQAKRRGRGVLIDHLTPTVREAGLYQEYSRLFDRLGRYSQTKAGGSETAAVELEQVRQLIRETGIDKDIGIQKLDEDALKRAEDYLLEIKASFMPYGLHTFGVSPTGEALDEMVRCILERNESVPKPSLVRDLAASGPREMERLLLGLSGGYVPPGEGNDPVRNPQALPTGRNFYGFDPARIPSEAAFELGRKAAEDILAKGRREKGGLPQKVAVVLWATETFRNGGVNECAILWLIGARPRWDAVGRVTGADLIPGPALGRPRIDVLIQPSGLYRDVFPNLLVYLDQAVQRAAAATDAENLLRKHTEAMKRRLLNLGVPDEQAEPLSRARIFSEAPGAYGTGVSEATSASGVWQTDDEIAQVFVNHVGFAFGAGQWGVSARDALRQNLKDVDAAVHSMSSNTYGVMDNDDVFQYVGGLALAVRKESGQAPETLLAWQRAAGSVNVESVARALGRELRARYLNPKWIDGMTKEGYAGAKEMCGFAGYLWGWQVTVPSAVDPGKWAETCEVYVDDKYHLGIKGFLNRENPWAYQAVTAWMLESIRRGYWDADPKTKEKLADEYATSVIEQGASCCCHACNNPFLNQMVGLILARPGAMGVGRAEKARQFEEAIRKVTWKSLGQQIQERTKLQEALKAGFGLDPSSGGLVQSQDQRRSPDRVSQEEKRPVPVSGYKMEPVGKQPESPRSPPSELQWHVLLFPVLVAALFLLGMLAARARRGGNGIKKGTGT